MKPKSPIIFATGRSITLNADDTLPQWIQVAPFGEHPTRDRQRIQVFNAEAADVIIEWFNSIHQRIARFMGINALPVWLGHPDFAPVEWPDKVRLGSVLELRKDEDGLSARVDWNAEAPGIIRDQGHKFASGAWDLEHIEGNRYMPAVLWSIGMWHKPNIKSVQPVINAEEELPTSNAELPTSNDTNPNTTEPMLNKIIAALREAGIIKEGDSEDSVLAQIGSMIQSLAWNRERRQQEAEQASRLRTAINAAEDEEIEINALVTRSAERITELNGEVTALRGQITTLTADHATALNAIRETAINALITEAITAGRITAADEESVRAELNADLDKGTAALNARKPALKSTPLDIGKTRPGIMNAQNRITELNAWVADYQAKNQCSYDEAFTASKADEKMKVIHAAMKSAA